MAIPKDLFETGRIKLYKSPASVMVEILKVILGLLAFWILKDWLFTKIYELSGWGFAKNWASISFLFWPAVIIVGLIIGQMIIIWLTKYYELRPDRIVIKSGMLSRTTRSIDIDQFAAVEFFQGFLGRVFGYGNIVFMFEAVTTAVVKQGVVFQGIRKPDKIIENAARYIKEGKPLNRGTTVDKQRAVINKVTPPSTVNEGNEVEDSEFVGPKADGLGGGSSSGREIITDDVQQTKIPDEAGANVRGKKTDKAGVVMKESEATTPETLETPELSPQEEKLPERVEPAKPIEEENLGSIQGEIDFSKHD